MHTYPEPLTNDNRGELCITTPDLTKVSDVIQHHSVKDLISLKNTNSTP